MNKLPNKILVDIDPGVINDVYVPFLDDTTRNQIFFGGSSSGKSVFLSQRTVIDLMRGRRNYLILRNVANTLRTSVFNEVCKVITAFGVEHLFNINNTNMAITCLINNKQALFWGLDDVQKVKGITPKDGVITDIWLEEATETKRTDIKELAKRLRGGDVKLKKRMTLSFNPILKTNWIYDEYFNNYWHEDKTFIRTPTGFILKTTYKDNRFLTPDDITELEDETDTYYYNVYTLGNWGILGDLVFKNWTIADLSEERKRFDKFKDGLDFGFTQDPTAYVNTALDRRNNTFYIFGGFYEKGLTNPAIAKALRQSVFFGNGRIRCDSAEPKSIQELRECGIDAIEAIKGQGSVNFGIQWLKQWDVIIDEKFQDAINEWSLYQYRQDKEGNVINEPIDKHNHTIDATRYAWSGVMFEDKEQQPAYGKNTYGIF